MEWRRSSMDATSTWRTSFLTLRDESLISPAPPSSLESLLHSLLFSQSQTLISAASDLPSHELTGDLIFLVELSSSESTVSIHTAHLIHAIVARRDVCLDLNSTDWAVILLFLDNLVNCLFHNKPSSPLQTADVTKAIAEIVQLLRNLVNQNVPNIENHPPLLALLLHIVAFSIANVDSNTKFLKAHTLAWEGQIIAFAIIGDALSTIGSSLSLQMWQSAVEVLRKVMDALVSKTLLVEDTVMSRFYASVLHCLHLLLSDPRGSLSEHVAGFVAALRMFFVYGLTKCSPTTCPVTTHKDKEFNDFTHKSVLAESSRPQHGAYRPPHLRKREGKSMPQLKASNSKIYSDNDRCVLGVSSSDSEHSDSDGFGKDMDYLRSSKTRIAAIICIQDLCQVDPKALTAHLTMLLPTNDVLQTRKHEATLMTCLLFDPVLKTRMTSASALAAMLTATSSVFLQVAEYKESTKCGSFTALSSSLGQILMQLHSGILYLVQREAHNGVLASLFKALMLLISATPYARMPGELLPAVISTLRMRMIDGFPSRTDQTGLMAILLNCLGVAFSTSPPSLQVRDLLQEEISTDFVGASRKQCLLSLIFQFSERATNPTLSFEALQVLRAVSHNYPNIMEACWVQVSTITYGLLRGNTAGVFRSESSIRLVKGDALNTSGVLGERCITSAVKVLDGCLRAISGFKGTEDVLDDRSLDTPFTSDCTRTKRISSAPTYGLDDPEISNGYLAKDSAGNEQWCEALEKHLPHILLHNSSMVRVASLTCFAGITSSVFFSLAKEKQEFILSSSISAALKDEVPSVRSAACRAIGVIACFPQISQSAEVLDKFIHAVETNTHDPLVSVRVTASWALANICDLLRHRASDFDLAMCSTDSHCRWIALLAECALRLSKDGDKIKSNAVRALGNLSRFVKFTSIAASHDVCSEGSSLTRTTTSVSHKAQTSRDLLGDPHWLDRMVQAFVSCVTTGNVKVRWNVCHALSNLFLNETLNLEDMTWAPSVFSVLLLLLRDSSNFKIRIHAAAALAVPSSRLDYGSSFSDVVQGLEHVLETLGSDQISAPSSFKYREALAKQLTSSTLHVLSLVSPTDHESLKDFLIKKAFFLEDWLSAIKSSLEGTSTYGPEATLADESERVESSFSMQKREMLQRTIRSLIDVFLLSNKHEIAGRLEKLIHSNMSN